MTSDTSVPQNIPFPRFLLDMKLSHTAKLIYSVLLYRANLSKINGWIDEQGRVYITFSLETIMETIHKTRTPVKKAMRELYNADLIERKRNYSAPNTIYVKLPTEGLKTDQAWVGKQTKRGSKNSPLDNRIRNKNKIIDRDTTQPAAAVSRTPLDIFREFAQEQAPGNRELLESLQDFDKNRQDIARANKKRRWTESAAKGICKKLVQLTDEAGVKDRTGYMCACLDSSVAVGWLSVYPYEHFTDHNPIIRDPVASRDRLHRSLVQKSEPDKPRKITKDTNLSDLINCAGIPSPACSTPAAQKEGGKHE